MGGAWWRFSRYRSRRNLADGLSRGNPLQVEFGEGVGSVPLVRNSVDFSAADPLKSFDRGRKEVLPAGSRHEVLHRDVRLIRIELKWTIGALSDDGVLPGYSAIGTGREFLVVHPGGLHEFKLILDAFLEALKNQTAGVARFPVLGRTE